MTVTVKRPYGGRPPRPTINDAATIKALVEQWYYLARYLWKRMAARNPYVKALGFRDGDAAVRPGQLSQGS